jgi:myo-inositol-1(or 4)-monophosphatase
VAQLSLGWVQGFWETDLQPYDIAAGLIMLSENGIVVTNEQGEDLNMFTDTLMVAAQPAVHAELLERVRSGYCSGNDPEPA